MKKKKLKQRQCPLSSVLYRFKIREGSLEGIRVTMEEVFVKEMSFKSGVKDQGLLL